MATKLYLHRLVYAGPGTLPGSSALGGTPTVTATGAATSHWLDTTIGAVAQTSTVTTTDGTANAQTAWFDRFLSAPLAAQTIAAQVITYSLAAAEGNANSNFNPTIFVGVWNPVAGSLRGTLLAVGTITATEPSTTQTATSGTGTSTQVIASAGDLIVVETWRKSVAPGATTARTNTTFWDGTTEASTTNVATFVNFANTLTFQAISAVPTALAMTWTGATPTVTATNNVTVAPTVLAMTWTGSTPTVAVTANVSAQPTALALTWTGATPSVTATANLTVLPGAASFTWTGATPAVTTPVLVQPSSIAFTLTFATPTVTATTAANVTVLPDAFSVTWTGATPTISLPVQVSPSALALTWTGSTPTVTAPAVSQPGAMTFTWTGAVPTVSLPIQVNPSGLAFTLTGATPSVATTAKIAVQPDPMAFIWTGAVPTVIGGGVASSGPGARRARTMIQAQWIPTETPAVNEDTETVLLF